MENYFILRVNYNNPKDYLKVIYIITKRFTVKGINWKITSGIHTFNSIYYDRTKYYSEPNL